MGKAKTQLDWSEPWEYHKLSDEEIAAVVDQNAGGAPAKPTPPATSSGSRVQAQEAEQKAANLKMQEVLRQQRKAREATPSPDTLRKEAEREAGKAPLPMGPNWKPAPLNVPATATGGKGMMLLNESPGRTPPPYARTMMDATAGMESPQARQKRLMAEYRMKGVSLKRRNEIIAALHNDYGVDVRGQKSYSPSHLLDTKGMSPEQVRKVVALQGKKAEAEQAGIVAGGKETQKDIALGTLVGLTKRVGIPALGANEYKLGAAGEEVAASVSMVANIALAAAGGAAGAAAIGKLAGVQELAPWLAHLVKWGIPGAAVAGSMEASRSALMWNEMTPEQRKKVATNILIQTTAGATGGIPPLSGGGVGTRLASAGIGAVAGGTVDATAQYLMNDRQVDPRMVAVAATLGGLGGYHAPEATARVPGMVPDARIPPMADPRAPILPEGPYAPRPVEGYRPVTAAEVARIPEGATRAPEPYAPAPMPEYRPVTVDEVARIPAATDAAPPAADSIPAPVRPPETRSPATGPDASLAETGAVEGGVGPKVAPLDTTRYGRMATNDIAAEPEIMQFRSGTGEGGQHAGLGEISKWDETKAGILQVWRRPSDGKVLVVNGHNRLALAKRLGVPDLAVQFIEADTPEQARLIGALANIADNNATAIDAAKVFRSIHADNLDAFLQGEGVALKGDVAEKGRGLAGLNDMLFGMVAREEGMFAGKQGVELGAIIGRELPESSQQVALMRGLDQRLKHGQKISPDAVEELIRRTKGGSTTTTKVQTLFGEEELTRNLAYEEAELSSELRARLGREARLHATASQAGNAAILESVGSTINREGSAAKAEQSRRISAVYDALSGKKGPVSDALHLAAQDIAKSPRSEHAAIKQRLYDAVSAAVEETLQGRGDAGVSGGRAVAPRQAEGPGLFEEPAATPVKKEPVRKVRKQAAPPAPEPTVTKEFDDAGSEVFVRSRTSPEYAAYSDAHDAYLKAQDAYKNALNRAAEVPPEELDSLANARDAARSVLRKTSAAYDAYFLKELAATAPPSDPTVTEPNYRDGRYWYRLTLRPASDSTTPAGPGRATFRALLPDGTVDDRGLVGYTRPLDPKDIKQYTLEPDVPAIQKGATNEAKPEAPAEGNLEGTRTADEGQGKQPPAVDEAQGQGEVWGIAVGQTVRVRNPYNNDVNPVVVQEVLSPTELRVSPPGKPEHSYNVNRSQVVADAVAGTESRLGALEDVIDGHAAVKDAREAGEGVDDAMSELRAAYERLGVTKRNAARYAKNDAPMPEFVKELADLQKGQGEVGPHTVYRADLPAAGNRQLSGVQDVGQVLGLTARAPDAPFEYFTFDKADAEHYASRDEAYLAQYEKAEPGKGAETFRILHGHEPRGKDTATLRTETITPKKTLDLTELGPTVDGNDFKRIMAKAAGIADLPKGYMWRDVPTEVKAKIVDLTRKYGLNAGDDAPTWSLLRNEMDAIEATLIERGQRTLSGWGEQVRGNLMGQFLRDFGYDSITYMHEGGGKPIKHLVVFKPEMMNGDYVHENVGDFGGKFVFKPADAGAKGATAVTVKPPDVSTESKADYVKRAMAGGIERGKAERLHRDAVEQAELNDRPLYKGVEKDYADIFAPETVQADWESEHPVRVAQDELNATLARLTENANEGLDDGMPNLGLSTKAVTTPHPTASDTVVNGSVAAQVEAEGYHPGYAAMVGAQPHGNMLARAVQWLRSTYAKYTKPVHPELDPHVANDAQAMKLLRQLPHIRANAQRVAINAINGLYKGMTGAETRLYEHAVRLRDFLHILDEEGGLPADAELPGYGMDRDVLRADVARMEAQVAANTKVQDRLAQRTKIMDDLKESLAEVYQRAGLPVPPMKRLDYYHHDVLGMESRDPSQSKRIGAKDLSQTKARKSWRDWNMNVAAVDMLHITDMMTKIGGDTKVLDTLEPMDIMARLKAELKAKKASGDLGPDATIADVLPAGYKSYQFKPGNRMYSIVGLTGENVQTGGKTPPAILADAAVARDLSTILDLPRNEAEAMIAKVRAAETLAMGGKNRVYILPENIVNALTDTSAGIGRKLGTIEGLTGYWKAIVMTSLRAQLRNAAGDTEAFTRGYAGAAKQVPDAAVELMKVIIGGHAPPHGSIMEKFLELSGLNVGSVQEALSGIDQTFLQTSNNPAIRAWKGVVRWQEWREAVLRYSVFKQVVADINANKGKVKNYGASLREEVDALADVYDKAHRISDDLLGSYESLSVGGQKLRRFAAPFYAWNEVNARRELGLLRNAKLEGQLAKHVAAKMPWLVAKYGVGVAKYILGAYMAISATRFFNQKFHAKEEETLPEDVKARPHIIAGSDSQGRVYYLDRLGALSDFLDTYGMGDAPGDFIAAISGTKSLKDVLSQTASGIPPALFNRAMQSAHPLVKTMFEIGGQKEFGLDFRQSRDIKDWNDYALRKTLIGPAMGLINPARKFFHKSTPDGPQNLREVAMDAAFKKNDPERVAAAEWARQGKETREEVKEPAGNAMYNYRRALADGKMKLADEWRAKAVTLGKTPQGIRDSIESQDPYYAEPALRDARKAQYLALPEGKRAILDADYMKVLDAFAKHDPQGAARLRAKHTRNLQNLLAGSPLSKVRQGTTRQGTSR